jgi:hypothetical protein
MRPRLRHPSRAAVPLIAGLLSLSLMAPASPVATTTGNVATPGNFTGFGFDQCLAPSQDAMDAWLDRSPFLAVGIYISGDSRACRNQPNLTPTWISTQLTKGWRLLPITLGPQASCNPRFPRYGNDETIDPHPGDTGNYALAATQGTAEGSKTVTDATALGLSQGSTLWYDLEGFDITKTNCRESALRFLSSWTARVRGLGFKAGVYSSASSGIKMLDDARIARPTAFSLPDYLWIARWDEEANTSTTYISDDGWNPHRRVKQYQGGHNETWGGVTINIDRDYLDVGRGTVAPPTQVHCDGVLLDFYVYNRLTPGVNRPDKTKALQCLLTERKLYAGKINGTYDAATIKAANAWQAKVGATVSSTWSVDNWMTLLTFGRHPVVKIGSASQAVRRLQRAINAGIWTPLPVSGIFDKATDSALREWQKAHGVPASGVAAWDTWQAMSS